MSDIINIFLDADLRCGHRGLREVIVSKGKNGNGYSVFINKSWMGLKMLTPDNQTLLYYKAPNARQPIDPETIKHLPYCVGGGKLDYSRALSATIKKRFEKRGWNV